ncbi:Syntaxin-12 [Dissostichus eleginoides]|uniref:Syntaxin-12 n=1 Tax=Dissostichus eleginoides TaxID=100907 RepID=A0AAD9C8G4_DISEL|nr:Syntaxin-12 [Dissostichus eleginoides]
MSYMSADSSWSQPRDFRSLIHTCSSNIQKISNNSGQIKNLLNQPGLRQESSELKEKLHLKELGSLPPPLSPSEQRQQKLQRERLMNDFSSALNNFQVVQRRAAEREKESVARARAGSRVLGDGGNVTDQLVTYEDEDEWGESQTQTEEPPVTEENLETIRERETNIRQLEANIKDVNQIFKDLAVMIHDQGEMIDTIEAHVESAEDHVDRGTVQLQKASYYKRKSRKRMCILTMVLSLVLIIFIIIIWQALK